MEMKKRFSIIALLTMIIASIAMVTSCKKNHEVEKQVNDTIVTDTIPEMTPMKAAEEMAILQKSLKEFKTVDSTFLALPKEIVILITKNNKEFTYYDVAKEYLKHKHLYDDWLSSYKQVEEVKQKTDTISKILDAVETNMYLPFIISSDYTSL